MLLTGGCEVCPYLAELLGAQENLGFAPGAGFVLLIPGRIWDSHSQTRSHPSPLLFDRERDHQRVNFKALSAGTFLVWLLPGVEWQTVNSSWFQGLVTALSSAWPTVRERCLSLPVPVSCAGRHGLCCEPGLEGKSLPLQSSLLPKVVTLSHCGGTGEQTELCVTTDGQDQKYHSCDVHHEFPLLVPGWRAVRGRASGRQGRGVVAVNYSCSLQTSEEHPASLDRAELV